MDCNTVCEVEVNTKEEDVNKLVKVCRANDSPTNIKPLLKSKPSKPIPCWQNSYQSKLHKSCQWLAEYPNLLVSRGELPGTKRHQKQRSKQQEKRCCEVDCQRGRGCEAGVEEQFEAQSCSNLNNDTKVEALFGGPPAQVVNPANI